ncbi:MAG: hypothetical protein ACYDCK_08445 [Thermoplasmatota archaeon]
MGVSDVMIHEAKPMLDDCREVKVRIPISYHVRLHSLKVLTGKPISDAVTEALRAYFSDRPAK